MVHLEIVHVVWRRLNKMTSLGVSPYDTHLSRFQEGGSPHAALRRRARRASITESPSMPLLSGFPFPFVQAPLPLTFAETNAIGTPVEVLSIRVSKPEARACIGVRRSPTIIASQG